MSLPFPPLRGACLASALIIAFFTSARLRADEPPATGTGAVQAVTEAQGSTDKEKPKVEGDKPAEGTAKPAEDPPKADEAPKSGEPPKPEETAPAETDVTLAAGEGEVTEVETLTPAKEEESKFGAVAQLEGGSGVKVATICTNCNQASLSINGVTGSDHVLVTLDGAPAVGGLGTVYVLTQFPSDMVGYTHVARGPGSVLSGAGGMGGSIEFHAAPRTTEQKSFLRLETGDWATHALKVAGADRYGPFGAMIVGQATTANNVDANRDGANEIADFERFTYHGLFDFHVGERDTIGLNYMYYSEDQDDGPGRPQSTTNDFADEDVFFNWHQYGVTWDHEGDDGSSIRFAANKSRRFQQQVAPSVPGGPPIAYLKVEDLRDFARIEGKVPIGRTGYLTSALGYQRVNIQWFNEEAFMERDVDDGLDHWELYTQYERSLGSHWDMSAGLRADKLTVFGRWRFDPSVPWNVDPEHGSTFGLPRLQFHWRPNAKVILGLSTGRFAVGPLPAAEKTCCGAQIARTIDTPLEDSWSYQAQLELHPTRDMRITTTIYRTEFDNYLQRVVARSSRGIPEYAMAAVPEARVQGLDIVHDMRFKGNEYNVGWTYTYSSPEDGDGKDLPYLARNAASAYLRYDRVGSGTKASFDVRWSGPIRHYQLSAALAPFQPPVGYREGEDFTTADVRFEQRIGKKGWGVEAGVANITDYVMSDLDRVDKNANGTDDIYERCYDWGPITGRYAWFAFKWSR